MDPAQGRPGRRPAAVTVAAWLLIVPASVGSLFAAVLALTRSGAPGELGVEVPPGVEQVAGVVAALVTLTIGGLLVYVGLSLLRLRRWARTVTLVIQGLWLVTWIALLGRRDVHPIQHLVRLVLPAAIVILLTLPTSLAAFYEDGRTTR